jgi:TonB family protein
MDALNQIEVTQEQALKYYNERRATLAQQQMLNPGVPVKTRTRVDPCPEPSVVNSGKASPSLADDNVAPESVYPPNAKALLVEGAVVLRVRVSETGCMQSADIVRTSGFVPLDESALVYAEHARYKPAVKDGKPAPGEFMFKIDFRLAD